MGVSGEELGNAGCHPTSPSLTCAHPHSPMLTYLLLSFILKAAELRKRFGSPECNCALSCCHSERSVLSTCGTTMVPGRSKLCSSCRRALADSFLGWSHRPARMDWEHRSGAYFLGFVCRLSFVVAAAAPCVPKAVRHDSS